MVVVVVVVVAVVVVVVFLFVVLVFLPHLLPSILPALGAAKQSHPFPPKMDRRSNRSNHRRLLFVPPRLFWISSLQRCLSVHLARTLPG